MKRILITGDAGYIGSVLLPLLLKENFKVTVFDSLLYGGSSLLPYISNNNFSFIKGDIRDKGLLAKAVKNKDIIIHLAAIVGLPACNKDKDLAYSTNVQGTRNVVNCLSPNQYLIHASTVSNYGASPGNTCDEKTPLRPVSYYGKTKTEAGKIVMEIKLILSCNKMKLENLTAFPDLEKPADETTWNVLGVGKAI